MAKLIDVKKKKNNVTLYLKKRGKYYTFRFQQADIDLLKLLFEFDTLALYQLEYYFERAYKITGNAVRKKLLRWRESKLVKFKRYTRSPTDKIFYQLDKNGLDTLKKLNIISDEDIKKDINSPDVNRNNSFDHYFCARDVALLTKISLKNSNAEIESAPWLYKEIDNLIPDWILINKKNECVLYIEADMGTEKSAAIQSKIKKYMELATKHPNRNVNVLFCVIDESDPALKYIRPLPVERYKRVWHLKNYIKEANGHTIKNLNFYVVNMSRAGYVGGKILIGSYPYTIDQKHTEIVEKTISTLKKTYRSLELLSPKDLYLSDEREELYGDGHFTIKNGGRENVIILKVLEEGSVKDIDILQFLLFLQKERRLKKTVKHIIGMYPYSDELHSDIIENTTGIIYLASIDEWYKAMVMEQTPPFYYRKDYKVLKEEKFYE